MDGDTATTTTTAVWPNNTAGDTGNNSSGTMRADTAAAGPSADEPPASVAEAEDLATLCVCSVLLALLFCAGTYGNVSALASFLDPALRRARSSLDVMLVNLALCDLLVSCALAPAFALVLFLQEHDAAAAAAADAAANGNYAYSGDYNHGGGDGNGSANSSGDKASEDKDANVIVVSNKDAAAATAATSAAVQGPAALCLAFAIAGSALPLLSLQTVAIVAVQRLRLVLGRLQPGRSSPSLPGALCLSLGLWTLALTVAALSTLAGSPAVRVRLCAAVSPGGAPSATVEPTPGHGWTAESVSGSWTQVAPQVYAVGFAGCLALVVASYALIAHALRRKARIRRCAIITVDVPRQREQPRAPARSGHRQQRRLSQQQQPQRSEQQRQHRQHQSQHHQQLSQQQQQSQHQHEQQQGHALATSNNQVASHARHPRPPAAAAAATHLNLSSSKDSRALITCVLIVVSALACCAPLGTTLALGDRATAAAGPRRERLHLCGAALALFKSALNPFLYSRGGPGPRRRASCCLRLVVALGCLCRCCRPKARSQGRGVGVGAAGGGAGGGGGGGMGARRPSRHDTNSAYILSPRAPRRQLVDRACGPSSSCRERTFAGSDVAGGGGGRDAGAAAGPRALASGCHPYVRRGDGTGSSVNTGVEPYSSSSGGGASQREVGSDGGFVHLPYRDDDDDDYDYNGGSLFRSSRTHSRLGAPSTLSANSSHQQQWQQHHHRYQQYQQQQHHPQQNVAKLSDFVAEGAAGEAGQIPVPSV